MRTVLQVAFHFPPSLGSSGFLRTLAFSNYLPESGWNSVILSAQPHLYEATNLDSISLISAATRVYRCGGFDASKSLAFKGSYLRIHALPDRWFSWYLFAMKESSGIISRARPDLIWSTSPIPTAHLIAYRLSKRFDLKWVADFRDPMVTDFDTPPRTLKDRILRVVEKKTMERAKAIVFATHAMAEDYGKRYPAHKHAFNVIENGWDETLFPKETPSKDALRKDTTVILHSGIVYKDGRNPSAFLRAVRDIIDSNHYCRQKLKIKFRAPGDELDLVGMVRDLGLSDVVEVLPLVSHSEATSEILGADILLLLQGAQFNRQIPTKFYEYLYSGAPVIAAIDSRGALYGEAVLLKGVFTADINTSAEIREAILGALMHVGSTQRRQIREFNSAYIKSKSRRSQTKSLALLLDEVDRS